MKLFLTDSIKGKVEFVPLDPKNVRMYVCGPTVYDDIHIGNARPVVVFDVLARVLRMLYHPEHVTYARNITDVDDKIIQRAKEQSLPPISLATRYYMRFLDDAKALGSLPADRELNVISSMEDIFDMITKLVDDGFAYVVPVPWPVGAPSGDPYRTYSNVFFDSTKSKPNPFIIPGDQARIEFSPYKRNPADFALWKATSPWELGWYSPWGWGRPGWHIECSTMASWLFGRQFDIHGGGVDLKFPHHANEIAQSHAYHGHEDTAWVQYWVHNGHVTVDNETMSKSLGNALTIRQILERGYTGETIRYSLLASHYRHPLPFSFDRLKQAESVLDALYLRMDDNEISALDHGHTYLVNWMNTDVARAILDDLNTPLAISALVNASKEAFPRELVASHILMGIPFSGHPHDWFYRGLTHEDVRRGNQKLALREEAREMKQYELADKIRDEVATGQFLSNVPRPIAVDDLPDGRTRWRRKV